MSLISEQFCIINQGIQTLNDILRHVQPTSALAYPLPATLKGMESEPITKISFDEYRGKDALYHAAQCYQDLHIKPDYSQKVARRTVGAICLSPLKSPEALLLPELINDINTAKTAIENYIKTTFQSRNERFEALRAECPKIMTMHLYRHIRCLSEQTIASARFSWQRKDSLSRPIKQELLQRMVKEMHRSGFEHQLPLEQLIAKVENTPEAQLRIRRPVPVQPVVNIKTDEGIKTVTAPMPLIFIQEDPIKLKSLAEFHANERRKIRSDKVAAEILGTFGGVTIEMFPA
ncbi:DNA replication terminus site-binding protein [Marinomonas algarum]|uniref:DNA replication terminus site-binding protein n=1 Tax=Marinomonas algarum TaxID=2883105 RepID=A0A9X1LE18_9GAMM|nr:DNA replication terminus site-binding protein [Marinomonas algarum]MCB5160753.1 DNA replication terminus site-binding protein [Marinomonas algarum]